MSCTSLSAYTAGGGGNAPVAVHQPFRHYTDVGRCTNPEGAHHLGDLAQLHTIDYDVGLVLSTVFHLISRPSAGAVLSGVTMWKPRVTLAGRSRDRLRG